MLKDNCNAGRTDVSDEWRMPTREELKKMASADIRTIDTSQLKELEDVHIDRELPRHERAVNYLRQIGNPYCYKSHGVAVKISFIGKRSLEECLCACLSTAEQDDRLRSGK